MNWSNWWFWTWSKSLKKKLWKVRPLIFIKLGLVAAIIAFIQCQTMTKASFIKSISKQRKKNWLIDHYNRTIHFNTLVWFLSWSTSATAVHENQSKTTLKMKFQFTRFTFGANFFCTTSICENTDFPSKPKVYRAKRQTILLSIKRKRNCWLRLVGDFEAKVA